MFNRVKLSPEAGEKYELIMSELQELVNLSHMSWGIMSRDAYDLDLKIAFAAGALACLAAGGIVLAGKHVCAKIKHCKNETEKES